MDQNILRRDEFNARRIVCEMKYQDQSKVMQDYQRLRSQYRNFYPNQVEAVARLGVQHLLCLQGYLEIYSSMSKTNLMLNCKIIFPKEYPHMSPNICVQNPNQHTQQCNPLYTMSGIASYVQHPIDKKYYLFFNTPKLKEWSPRSDIVQIVREIAARLRDNFPFVRIQQKLHSSPSMTIEKQSMHPTLKNELQKTEMQYMQLQSQSSILVHHRKQVVFDIAYHQVIGQQLQMKRKIISKYCQDINNSIDKYSQLQVNDSTIEKMLVCQDKTKKLIQLISQKDALQQTLSYLKDQLKKGVTMSVISKFTKQIFEEMFDNQLKLNQIV